MFVVVLEFHSRSATKISFEDMFFIPYVLVLQFLFNCRVNFCSLFMYVQKKGVGFSHSVSGVLLFHGRVFVHSSIDPNSLAIYPNVNSQWGSLMSCPINDDLCLGKDFKYLLPFVLCLTLGGLWDSFCWELPIHVTKQQEVL